MEGWPFPLQLAEVPVPNLRIGHLNTFFSECLENLP